ncbi:unnamed protein product [Somion occarium]|uniref:Uncharacterized protein n=1 Tax=Somion occarium TaxID=3059160 RepID=A0ABP1EDG4_9APHY
MTANRQSSQTSTVVLEAMHPHPSTSKRKTPDDGNPLDVMVAKKARKEKPKSGATSKRKLVGEEQPGGLVIVRAPSTRLPASQGGNPPNIDAQPHQRPPSRSASIQPPQQHPPNANASKPPSKKFKADTADTIRRSAKGKERELLPGPRSEPEMDEDVRRMQSEADTLRHKPRIGNGVVDPSFQFPPSRISRPTTSSDRIRDISQPIAEQETPQIMKNKIMRGEMPHPRRKSSISRGKRASSSFENTGVITQPHTSVADSTFYKHIDVDLPEPQRAQQLLICSRRNVASAGKDPPLLTEDMQLLKSVQEEVIRMLAEKRIDTSVFSQPESAPPREKLRENEQNVRNRAREKKFNDHIQRSKMEKEAWTEVDSFYKQHRLAVLTDLEKREREISHSAKVKGKQRATLEDIEKWEADLPEHFRRVEGLALAKTLVGAETDRKTPVSERIQDLEFSADRVHGLSHSALETTHVAEADLDRRFARLNISLANRSQTLASTLNQSATALSSYLPTTLSRPPPTTDPQGLLRALSRVDAERPQSQVGDAARRAAREVQRAHDAGVSMAERKLTGVAPPTPRKPPGTPRRATIPGKGR